MAAEHDTSWDVAVLEQTPEGCYIARRPPAEERPVARKLLLGHYMQDAAAHRAAVQNVFGERLETIIEAQQTLRTDHDTLVQSLRADARNTSAQVLSLQTRLLDLSGRVVRYEDVIELYETVARTLQGFNDLIFLKLTLGEKEYLRTQGITYILVFSGIVAQEWHEGNK
ncbi:hypothetical protein C8R47DRAFT_1069278 [Mycena vitilis]|nr:hypothetical protein C8R47DRAFT_1069278 [Mycena vitilis]